MVKIGLASGETFDEASFFGFEYAYFVTGEFPYFIAKYRGQTSPMTVAHLMEGEVDLPALDY